MLRQILPCIVSATLLSPLAAWAQADPVDLDCEVNGYDVIIRNVGDAIFPVGATIDWAVRFSRSAGAHRLEKPLEPGARIYLSGVLEASYLNPGTPCTVAIAQAGAAADEDAPEEGQ